MKNLLKEKKSYEFLIGKVIKGTGRIKEIIIGPKDENIFISDYYPKYLNHPETVNDILYYNEKDLALFVIFEPWIGSGFPFNRLDDFLENKKEEIDAIRSKTE